MDSAPTSADAPADNQDLAYRFRDRFESLLPEIQKLWPEVTHQALEATRGSFDEVVQLISTQSDRAASLVTVQLEDLLHQAGDRTRNLADNLDPLEEQLEHLQVKGHKHQHLVLICQLLLVELLINLQFVFQEAWEHPQYIHLKH